MLKPVELFKTNKVYKTSETFKAGSLKTKHKTWLELTHDQHILKAIEQRFSENKRSLLVNELLKLESFGCNTASYRFYK